MYSSTNQLVKLEPSSVIIITYLVRLLCWIFSAYASIFMGGLTLIVNTQHYLKYGKPNINVSIHVSATIVYMALYLFGTCTFLNKIRFNLLNIW